MNYSLLSFAALYGSSKHSDHRVMQNKEYDISLSRYCVKRRENPEVAIFTCTLYERSSILSVRTLISVLVFGLEHCLSNLIKHDKFRIEFCCGRILAIQGGIKKFVST